MAISIKNNFFLNCGTAVSTVADVDADIDDNLMVDCDYGVVIRDPAEIARMFDIEEEVVLDVLARLAPHKCASLEKQEEVVKASPFWDAVGKAADLTAVLPLLLSLL